MNLTKNIYCLDYNEYNYDYVKNKKLPKKHKNAPVNKYQINEKREKETKIK